MTVTVAGMKDLSVPLVGPQGSQDGLGEPLSYSETRLPEGPDPTDLYFVYSANADDVWDIVPCWDSDRSQRAGGGG